MSSGRWAWREGLRPSLQTQRPELNYKDNSFNLFLPLRVYFYECSRGEPRECERNESVAEGQSGHTFMLCFTSLRQTRRQDGNYFSCCGRRSRLSSSSWVWSILDGASIITSRPWLFFGKAMKSRMDSLPANSVQTRSKPNARPP